MGNNKKEPFISGTGQVLPHGYEYKMVAILGLTIGFVMFDRFAVANLQSYMKADLGLSNTSLGIITAVFAATWAASGVLGSYIADAKMSRKKFLGIFVLFFSVCSLLTGFCTGFIMLVVVRAVMGIFEGPMYPTAQSFVMPQSSNERRGMNMGLVQVTIIGLVATTLGPIVQVGLAESIGWRWTFAVTIIPGVILTLFIFKTLVDPQTGGSATEAEKAPKEKGSLFKSLANRNIIVCIISSIFLLTWYIGVLTFMPGYLVEVRGFSATEMSFIMSGFGIGAVVLGGLVLPRLSDKIGRKPVVIISAILGAIAAFGLIYGPNNVPLMVVIAFIGWGGTGVNSMLQAAIPGESADPRYVGTSIGTIQLTGELLGATLGATLLGVLADAQGLQAPILVCGISILVTAVLALFFRETAPLVVAKREARMAQKQ
ncbi:MAG: MFS transporter [Clostridiales Family XIII bacterium]|jgi:predicted MFS family arabinose efflux permease|nr:MFS transporter [Clostridiales Family XIII bacterium]